VLTRQRSPSVCCDHLPSGHDTPLHGTPVISARCAFTCVVLDWKSVQ